VTLRQLGAVFGVLAALAAVWLSVRNRDSSTEPSLDLGALIQLDVDEITISPPDTSTVRLQLTSGHWTVNGYPARDSLVQALLGRLDTLPQAHLIARSPATHERLGVTPETATRVEVGSTTSSGVVFLLGGTGPEGRFVRIPEQTDVFVIPETAVQDLDREEFRWRDPTIVTVDTASLSRIVVRRGSDQPLALRRNEVGNWLVDGVPADTIAMRMFLETVEDMQAVGFPADSFVFAVDFDRPDAILDLYLRDDLTDAPTVSLLFASIPTRTDVLVRRADDPIVYAVDSRRANLLTASRSRLLRQP